MKLIFGVVDIPYSDAFSASERRTIRWAKKIPSWRRIPSTTTTGDVAEFLEARYSVMATFYLLHGQDIGEALEKVLQTKLDNLMMGGPVNERVFEPGDLSSIDELFRKFLDNKEMDGRAGGVPTMASLRGVNHRMKQPYAKRAPRPSFIDTGLYSQSFKSWTRDS